VLPIEASEASASAIGQIIQLAIAPVFLLAGIGAFLNVSAGRLSRIVDRSRSIEPLLLESRGSEHDRWLGELRALGLVTAAHGVEEFDFKTVNLHFNAFGMEGEALVDADPALIRAGSNLHPVVPSMANLNLNNYVPRTVADVGAVLARPRSLPAC